MYSISVIIPTYNRSESLKRTLLELSKSSILPQEVIVIDQSTKEEIRTEIINTCALYPYVNYHFNSEPSSTMARNSGMNFATGDIFVFMDDDVDVKVNTFELIQEKFETDNVAMIAGINEPEANLKNSLLGTLFYKSSFKRRFKGHVTKAVYGRFPINVTKPVETEWAMGFFFAIKAKIAKEANITFDEKLKYYAYAEDLDFTYRYFQEAKRRGEKCMVYPEIQVLHNVVPVARNSNRRLTFLKILHRQYIAQKLWGGTGHYFARRWSEIGDLFLAITRRESAQDHIDAIKFANKYSKDIKQGILHYDKFWN